MEQSGQTGTNIAPERRGMRSRWTAVVAGCLALGVVCMCMAAALVMLVARPDTPGYAGWQGDRAGAGGEAANGQQVFRSRCAACHSTGTDADYGPGLAGLFEPGGPELPPGVDYGGKLPNGEEITEASVADWVRSGGRGEIGFMPPQPLGDAEMDALIEYMKTLEK